MTTPFARAFVKLRRQAGFATAYQFYHKNGGRRTLGCSFQNYLRIENGANLPVPARLPRLCQLLRLPLRGSDMRLVLRAYLETWAGSADLASWLTAPFEQPTDAEPAPGPGQAALSRLLRESAKPLSLAQYEAVMSDAASYWCFRVLTTDAGTHSVADLARILGFPAARIRRGLEVLSRCAVARRCPDGRFESPYAGALLTFPDAAVLPQRLRERAEAYTREMVRRKGGVVDVRHCAVRADAGAIQGFIPHLREAMRGVNAYAVTERTGRSALFLVEGRVTRLFDF